MRVLRGVFVLVTAVVVTFGIQGGALAHEHRTVRSVELIVGWQVEPTYAGYVNGVQVSALRGGQPLTDGKLQAVVIFGPRTGSVRSPSITLAPSDEHPGEYDGPIIPTRPGTYTFHITGSVGKTAVDEYFTSSETTFDDVKAPAADEFPAKDPTTGQLAQRLGGVERIASTARSRARLGVIGLLVGALGLVVAATSFVRRP